MLFISLSTLVSICDCSKSCNKQQTMKILRTKKMQTRFSKEFLEMFFQIFEHIFHNRMTMFVLPIVQQLKNNIMPFFLK